MYAEVAKGHPRVPPAQLALTVILQAYTKASDAEAIEALTMDRRWQLICWVTLSKKRHCVIARQQGRELAEVATEAGAEILTASSLKAALEGV